MGYWEVSVDGWLAMLGGMALGAALFAAGYREGRRAPGKPVVAPYPGIGGDLD